MESEDDDCERGGQYGSEHVGPRPLGVCTCQRTVTIGFRPMPGDIRANEIGFHQCHCCCGREQQLPASSHHGPTYTDGYRSHEPPEDYRNNSPFAHTHSGSSCGEMFPNGFRHESGRFDKDAFHQPYPNVDPNEGNQYPGQVNSIGVNSAHQTGIRFGAAAYGESGNVASASTSQNQDEYAPDGVRLLKYSGS